VKGNDHASVNNVIIENAIVLNVMHNIVNLRNTNVGLCIILVLLKGTGGLNSYPNIR